MNCFNHSHVSAVGVCKNCQRGLCRDCLTMIDDAIVCRGSCEEKVIALHKMLAQTYRTQILNRSAYGRNFLIYLITGTVIGATAYFNLKNDPRSIFGVMLIALSGSMLLGAFNSYRAWNASKESPADNPNSFSRHIPNSQVPPSDPNQPFQSPPLPGHNHNNP